MAESRSGSAGPPDPSFLAAYLGLTLPVLALGAATLFAALPVALTVNAALAAVVAVPAGRAVRRSGPRPRLRPGA